MAENQTHLTKSLTYYRFCYVWKVGDVWWRNPDKFLDKFGSLVGFFMARTRMLFNNKFLETARKAAAVPTRGWTHRREKYVLKYAASKAREGVKDTFEAHEVRRWNVQERVRGGQTHIRQAGILGLNESDRFLPLWHDKESGFVCLIPRPCG